MLRLILRTGIDLLEINRLDALSPNIRARFIKRVFTSKELEQSKDSTSSLSGLFCVKEAVSKALGCGIGEVGWKEIETLADSMGAPVIVLHGNAARIAKKLSLTDWAVSITHTRQVAAATVTAIGFISENEDSLSQ
ncbi:MAG TPA: holo-ACP synthase [Leptolinea sp.]